jgi:hypothetical protein
MSEGQGGLENPSRGELTNQRKNQPEQGGARKEVTATTALAPLAQEQQGWYRRPHAELVKGFRDFIQQQRQEYAHIHSPGEREYWPPAETIRKKLDNEAEVHLNSTNENERDFYFLTRTAWDALAYEHYEPGSEAEGLGGSVLSAYYQATRKPVIKLSDPQIHIIDAMSEAVGIPRQKGTREIEIPDKLKNYNQWLMSKDYQERLAMAKAKK